MNLVKSFDDSLLELQQQVSRKRKLEAKLNDLRNQRRTFDKKVIDLGAAHRSEQADVGKLEGRSLAKYFYQIVGKRDEKLDEERRQAAAAKVKLDAALRELTAVDDEIQQIQSQLRELAGCDETYAAALERKRNEVKSSATPVAAEILGLEERIALLQIQKLEIQEAVLAGQSALTTADAVLSELDSAESWNTWDMFGGGGVLTHLAKHSHLDDAQEKVERLQGKLRSFRTELADIDIHADLQVNIDGFLRFADYVFDGLFVDWTVGNQISESRSAAQKVKAQIQSALTKLSTMEASANQEIITLEAKIEYLLLQG